MAIIFIDIIIIKNGQYLQSSNDRGEETYLKHLRSFLAHGEHSLNDITINMINMWLLFWNVDVYRTV